MKTKYFAKYFTKVEEKYVFNISLIFWHIFIGLGALGVVVGILLLIWGIIPPFKSWVRKEKYPPTITVSLEELQTKVIPAKVKPEVKVEKEKPKPKEEKPKEVSPEENEYIASLDSLKVLIPPEKYLWDSKGHWVYPYGRDYWEYYKTSQYRKWVIYKMGINDRLKSAYKSANAVDFLNKKRLLDVYISTVRLFPEDKRVSILKALITYTKESVSQSLANVQLLTKSIPNFSTELVDYLTKLAKFGKKNPRDGYTFIEYVNKTIGKFDVEKRVGVLDVLIANYSKYFNNVARQIEATDLFLPMIAEFEPKYQVEALRHYYRIYHNKNAERERTIRKIDRQYEQASATAEAKYQSAKLKKAGSRIKGLKSIGGGIVLIAVLALMLVLFSIQRSLKKIEEKMAKE